MEVWAIKMIETTYRKISCRRSFEAWLFDVVCFYVSCLIFPVVLLIQFIIVEPYILTKKTTKKIIAVMYKIFVYGLSYPFKFIYTRCRRKRGYYDELS